MKKKKRKKRKVIQNLLALSHTEKINNPINGRYRNHPRFSLLNRRRSGRRINRRYGSGITVSISLLVGCTGGCEVSIKIDLGALNVTACDVQLGEHSRHVCWTHTKYIGTRPDERGPIDEFLRDSFWVNTPVHMKSAYSRSFFIYIKLQIREAGNSKNRGGRRRRRRNVRPS